MYVMKVLVQIVKNASVTIDNKLHRQIGYGLLYFVAFKAGDTHQIIDKMIDKLLKLRIFPDENGKTNLSLAAINGEVLSVSQFTLYADVKDGNRPSFTKSLAGASSVILYDYFNEQLRNKGVKLQCGIFGADMKVSLVNDGPFTILLDSDELYG